jgi:hypothetical protein
VWARSQLIKERRKNNFPFYGGLLPSYCPFFSLNNALFASKNSQSEAKIPALKLVTYFFAVPYFSNFAPHRTFISDVTQMDFYHLGLAVVVPGIAALFFATSQKIG